MERDRGKLRQGGSFIKYLDNVWESVEIVISDDVMIFYEFHHSSTKSDQEFGHRLRILVYNKIISLCIGI